MFQNLLLSTIRNAIYNKIDDKHHIQNLVINWKTRLQAKANQLNRGGHRTVPFRLYFNLEALILRLICICS